ncbi:MAG: RHS repeat-associated core domain-containing protein [Candidatus Nitrosocosmicus sp.]
MIRTVSTAPFSIVQTFEYNRMGLIQRSLTDLKDSNNDLTDLYEKVNKYDDQLHLVRQVEGASTEGKINISKAIFDAAGRPRISIDFSGLKVKYTYNERGFKARAISDYGGIHATTSFRYDADGRLVSSTDANGNITRWKYDAKGRLIDEEDALGNHTIIHYDKADNLLLHLVFEKVGDNVFRLLTRKKFEYDALKRMTIGGINKFESTTIVTKDQLLNSFITDEPGELLTCEYYYSASGQLYQFKDWGEQTYRSEYDILGRLKRSIDPLGDDIRYTYDAENNITRVDRKEVTWNENRTQIIHEQYFAMTNRYDEFNRLVEETNSLGCKLSYAYDSRDNIVRLSGPLDTITENTYDIFSRIITKTEHLYQHIEGESPIPIHTRYEYGKFDKVVRQTDPLGRVTQFEYDTMGRLTSTILPDQSFDRIIYDKCGNVVQFQGRNNMLKLYQYNALHKQTECRIDVSEITAGNTIEGSSIYHTTYDALGRAIALENDICRIENSYNSLNWNIDETTSFQNIPNSSGLTGLRIQREFNNTNGLTVLQYPSGRKVVFNRDVLDRITEVRQLQKGNDYPGEVLTPDNFPIVTMSYEGLRKKNIARSNGCHTQLSYDFGARILQIVHVLNNTTLLDCRYLYDALSNMCNKSEWTNNSTIVQQFSFDSLSQLREVKSSPTLSIDISQLGPSLQPVPDTIPLFQDQINQRMVTGVAVEEMRLDYDRMGNRLLVSTPAGNESYQPQPNDQYREVNGRPLVYDANGNLAEDPQFSYRYDCNNQLSRIENKNTGAVALLFYDPLGRKCVQQTEEGTRLTVYNGHQVMEEYLNGTLVSSMVSDPGHDVPLLNSKNNMELFYCGDISLSTRIVMNGSHPLVSYSYDAFGNLQETALESNEFLFGGKRMISGTGVYDFLFRTYDPVMGRFLQRDPAGYIDGLNLYTYAGNNPLSYGDPTGLERKELLLGKEIGANFAGPDLDIHDPNLGMDDISKYYFDEQGNFLRWNEHTGAWVEDLTGVNNIIDNAPEPKKSWMERYLNGVKRGLLAPVHLAKDTVFKVVDVYTQGFAVLGKVTGGWDVGYTTLSSTSKAVEAGVSQKELIWQATGGLVVNPIIAAGDIIFKQDPDALGEMVGGAMVGYAFKGFKDRGGGISGVASHGGSGVQPMTVTRIIRHGEKIKDIIHEVKELTFGTGNEHAVVKLASGERAIISGGPTGISWETGQITRLFGHSHPYHLPATSASAADFAALRSLQQRSSYLIEHGNLMRFRIGGTVEDVPIK